MRAAYRNSVIRAELGGITGGTNIIGEAGAVIKSLVENGLSADKATAYVNDSFLDLLSEFISGGIVTRSVKEIGSSPEYYQSQERQAGSEAENTFTLTKKLSVDVGKISPYIDVTFRAGPVELKKTRFPFRLSGKVTLANPRITVFKKKIVRAALGTMTPSFSIYYTGGGKERLIHTFEKPIRFDEIDFTKPATGRDEGAGPSVALP